MSKNQIPLNVRGSEFSKLRDKLKRLPKHVTAVRFCLDRPDFLFLASAEDIPRQIKFVEINYQYDHGLPFAAGIVDVHGRSMTHPPQKKDSDVPKEAVERFAALLPDLHVEFSMGIPWDTTVTFVKGRGWESRYDP